MFRGFGLHGQGHEFVHPFAELLSRAPGLALISRKLYKDFRVIRSRTRMLILVVR